MVETPHNLEKMKESLRQKRLMEQFGALHTKKEDSLSEDNGVGNGTSPEEFYPSQRRENKMRWNKVGWIPWGFIRFLMLAIVLVGVFCMIDFGRYRQWIEATRMLLILRDHPHDELEAKHLKQLADEVDDDNVDLKSGLEGVLAVRRVGLGPREAGFQECDRVVARYSGSWVNQYLSRDAFFTSCDVCKGVGRCLKCNGTGLHIEECHRCNGKGVPLLPNKEMKRDSFSRGSKYVAIGDERNSRPVGYGEIRNTGKFIRIGPSSRTICLACRGTGKYSCSCDACDGTGFCLSCKGGKRSFTTAKVAVQYREIIDHIVGLYPKWVVTVVNQQTWLKGVLSLRKTY